MYQWRPAPGYRSNGRNNGGGAKLMAHRLAITRIEFNKRGKPKEVLKLGNLDGSGGHALDFFRKVIKEADWQPEKKRHAIRGNNDELACEHPEMVAGMMLAGERGIHAGRYKQDFTTPDGVRTEEDIEAPSVFVAAYMPSAATVGYLVTHTYHGRYFKTGLLQALPGVLLTIFPEAVVTTSTWAPKADLAAVLKEGAVLELELERHQTVDQYRPFTAKSAGTQRLSLLPDGPNARFDIEALVAAHENEEKLEEILEVADVKYHSLSATVKYKGSTRVFTLGEANDDWLTWDISPEVGDVARPEPAALLQAAVQLLKDQKLLP